MKEYHILTVNPNLQEVWRRVNATPMTIVGFEEYEFFVTHIGVYHWSVVCGQTGRSVATGLTKRRAMVAAYKALDEMGKACFEEQTTAYAIQQEDSNPNAYNFLK